MTQSNGEDPQQRRRGLQRIQDGIQSRLHRSQKRVQNVTREDVRGFFQRNGFVLFTIAAVVIGIILGFGLRPYNLSYRQVKYFSFPGELLMRMLQMLVLPLLVSSLITVLLWFQTLESC